MKYLGYCGKYNHILIELNLLVMKKYLVAIISSLLAFVGCTETAIGYESLEDFINSGDIGNAENFIFYTSSDGKIVEPTQSGVEIFGANIVSNTYENGLGIIEFDGPVTTIGDHAFYLCKSLTRVTIPNRVTSIGYGAFYHCKSLTSVTIPKSVTTIGDYAFFDCSSLNAFYGKFASKDNRCLVVDGKLVAFAPSGLTEYTIPNKVSSIGDSVFAECSSLISVTISKSVTSIGNYAFGSCSSLNAFYGKFASNDNRCLVVDGKLVAFAPSGLTEYTIPDSVISIRSTAFYCCYSLTSVTIPDSVISIGSCAFHLCTSLTSVTIGNSLTFIGDHAFYHCYSLTSVTIPDSVTSIGHDAFTYCYSLKEVYCKPTTPPSSSGMFDYNVSGRKIYVPTASVSQYKTASGWSDYASDIVGYNF